MAVGFVLTGIVGYDKLNVADPIAVGIDAIGLKWLAPIMKLGIIFGLTSVILVGMLWSAAHRLFDGARWPVAAAFRREVHRALPHALRHHDHYGYCR